MNVVRTIALAAALAAFASSAQAAADATKGKQIFGRCAQCHNVVKDGGNGLGPNLFGVAGRKAASIANFSYSPALKNSGISWSDNKLTAWITHPSALVPGNRMAFAGISDQDQVADVVAYLKTLK